jgi:asparagine synthase (glutamine-hydrolysing)
MRAQGVKVALNGAAGDENFGGYGFHYSLMQAGRLARAGIAGYCTAALAQKDTSGILMPYVKPLAYLLRERGRGRSLNLHARLVQDMIATLMPYWLASGDRSYMGVPIEIREPFLDYRVVEFAFTLPLGYLIRDGWQKWIVRKALEKHLPAGVVWRRRKMGFPFPIQSFLKMSRPIINSIISASSSPWKQQYPEKWWRSGWKQLSYLLWYEHFIAGNGPLFYTIKQMAGPGGCRAMQPEYIKTLGR